MGKNNNLKKPGIFKSAAGYIISPHIFSKRDRNPFQRSGDAIRLMKLAKSRIRPNARKQYNTYAEALRDNPELDNVRLTVMKRMRRERHVGVCLIVIWQIMFWHYFEEYFTGVFGKLIYVQITLLTVSILWRADFLYTMYFRKRARFTFSDWLKVRLYNE